MGLKAGGCYLHGRRDNEACARSSADGYLHPKVEAVTDKKQHHGRACKEAAGVGHHKELFRSAKSIGHIPGHDTSEVDLEDSESCFKYIDAYMSVEQGMRELLSLKETVMSAKQIHTVVCRSEIDTNTYNTHALHQLPSDNIDTPPSHIIFTKGVKKGVNLKLAQICKKCLQSMSNLAEESANEGYLPDSLT